MKEMLFRVSAGDTMRQLLRLLRFLSHISFVQFVNNLPYLSSFSLDRRLRDCSAFQISYRRLVYHRKTTWVGCELLKAVKRNQADDRVSKLMASRRKRILNHLGLWDFVVHFPLTHACNDPILRSTKRPSLSESDLYFLLQKEFSYKVLVPGIP